MEVIKKLFRIESKYHFEWNDVRALTMVLNVVLVMLFGFSASWFGLGIAVLGLIKDFCDERHLNGILMHLASIVLNLYFLSLLYGA